MAGDNRDQKQKACGVNNWKREKWMRGDTIAIELEDIKDVTGALVTDFTGYKFHASLKLNKTDLDGAALALIETSGFVTSGSTARAYLVTEGLSLTLGADYYLDAQVIDGNSYVSTLLQRIINFEQDISRRVVDTP